jgi:hypothetical protein
MGHIHMQFANRDDMDDSRGVTRPAESYSGPGERSTLRNEIKYYDKVGS